jgi:hypothetical protein
LRCGIYIEASFGFEMPRLGVETQCPGCASVNGALTGAGERQCVGTTVEWKKSGAEGYSCAT